MTREQAEALGRRALAAGWLESEGALYRQAEASAFPGWERLDSSHSAPSGYWPDLRDDATRGILLGQVREAWGQPSFYVFYNPNTKMWLARYCTSWASWWTGDPNDTEAEALVAALEAVPKSALAKSPTDAPS